jgi:hypothetical protein
MAGGGCRINAMRRSPIRRRASGSLPDPTPEDAVLARAREFGVDVSLLIENLRLTPEERLIRATSFHNSAARMTREVARTRKR